MTIGIDTFLTLDEANSIIADSFIESETEFIEWGKLTDNHKTILIKRGTLEVNKYNFVGTSIKTYKLKFPRLINNEIVIPDEIKKAALMFGLYQYIDKINTSSSEYAALIKSGVKSISTGPNSVSFNAEYIADYHSNIICDIASRYILRYKKII